MNKITHGRYKERVRELSEERLRASKLPYKGLIMLSGQIRRYLWIMPVIFLLSVLLSLTNVVFIGVVERLELLFGTEDNTQRVIVPALLIGVALARGICSSVVVVLSSYLSLNMSHDLSVRMYKHIVRLPLDFFDSSSVGDIMSKVSYNISAISSAIQRGILVLIKEVITLIGIIGYLLYLNWLLSLILLTVFPIIVLVLERVRRSMKKIASKIKANSEDGFRHMVDVLSASMSVKISGTEDREAKAFENISSYGRKQAMKANLITYSTSPLALFIMSIPFAFILYQGVSGGIGSFEGVGQMMAYFAAFFMMNTSIRLLSGVQQAMEAGELATYDYVHYISMDPEKDQGSIIIDKKTMKGELKIEGLNFSYEEDKPVLQDVNLVFAAGKSNAMVGLSGSGKSTLVNLIMRLYEFEEGKILLDGIDIREISLKSLRKNIAYVSQEIFLFNNTLRHNIAYGADEITDEQIYKTLESANMSEFVKELPQGLDTPLGEGGISLSGGQKQRLSIARALIKNSPLLIMDEATSSLDVKNEYQIRKSINALMKNRTVIVIAHRLTTVEKMDRIIMLDGGKVVGVGSHADLLKDNEAYKELCSYQLMD